MADTAHHPSATYNTLSPRTMGLSHGSTTNEAELSGEAAPSMSELSPIPERSSINTPKRAIVPESQEGGVRTEPAPPAWRREMQPSLRSSTRSSKDEGVEANGRTHVMSWIDYDANTPSPAR